jgi:ATP-dependent DNA helicase RecQ
MHMAMIYPVTTEAFRRVHGVGEHKAAVYGEAFLAVIRAYVEENDVAPPEIGPAAPPRPKVGRSARRTGKAFRGGATLSQIAASQQITEATVLSHLQEYQAAGGELDPDRLLAECRAGPEEQACALAHFGTVAGDSLSSIREALGGKVDYRDLRLLRMVHRSRRLSGVCADPRSGRVDDGQ